MEPEWRVTSPVQHLRRGALGQPARTDLQNLGACYIRPSCRALPFILGEGRNGAARCPQRVSPGRRGVGRPLRSSHIKANELEQSSLLCRPFPVQRRRLGCSGGSEPARGAPEAASAGRDAQRSAAASANRLRSKQHASASLIIRCAKRAGSRYQPCGAQATAVTVSIKVKRFPESC